MAGMTWITIPSGRSSWDMVLRMRVLLLAAMALVAVNIWTGAPLLALWIGSRIQGDSGLSMGAVFTVIAVMGATMYGLVRLLGALGARWCSSRRWPSRSSSSSSRARRSATARA